MNYGAAGRLGQPPSTMWQGLSDGEAEGSLLPPSDPQIGSLLTERWYAP